MSFACVLDASLVTADERLACAVAGKGFDVWHIADVEGQAGRR